MMSVLALLDRQAGAFVQHELGSSYLVHVATSSDEFERGLEETNPDAVVVDPALFGGVGASVNAVTLPNALRHSPSLPVVVYSEPSHAAFVGLARLMGRRHLRLVVRLGVNDIGELRLALIEASRTDAADAMLRAIVGPLGALDHGLGRCIAALFHRGATFRTVTELAIAAHSSRRSVHRHLRAAGFASAERVLGAAHIIELHEMLARGPVSIDRAATVLGYASVGGLRALTRRALGLTPSALRSLSEDALVEALTAWLITKAPSTGSAELAPGERNVRRAARARRGGRAPVLRPVRTGDI
jgi:AraC-like DNA-binding protein